VAGFILSCCSTADMDPAHFEARDIRYVCFHFRLNGKEYPDDLGKSIPFPAFYAALTPEADVETSQVNIQEYLDYFDGFLRQGMDIVHVCLSSGISGTINSAENAARIARERYPERQIFIVDSLGASSGYGLLMDRLADLRDQGMEAEALARWAEENRLRLNHWFFSTDLSFYVKGGRISKAAGIFGGMLGICPLLDMDGHGRLVPRYKIRGKRKVIQEIVRMMELNAEGGLNYDGRCWISQSDCMEDAREVADLVEARFPKLKGRVEIFYVGTTIGSHTGPGTVALFFWGKERELPHAGVHN